MEFNSNKLIKANEKLINDFNREYEMNAEKLAVHGFEQYPNIDGLIPTDETKLKMNSQALAEYKERFQRQFYEQIVKSIIAVEKKNYTIFELSWLVNQLSELKDIFFDKLNSEVDTYWQMMELFRNEFDDGITYPNPNELTKEFVVNFLHGIKIDVPSTENHSWTKYENEAWFKVAVEDAKGKIHELKTLGKDDTEVADILFHDVPKSKNERIKAGYGFKRDTLRVWIGQREKIYAKKDEALNAVVNYCEYHNIPIKNDKFSERSAIQKIKP